MHTVEIRGNGYFSDEEMEVEVQLIRLYNENEYALEFVISLLGIIISEKYFKRKPITKRSKYVRKYKKRI